MRYPIPAKVAKLISANRDLINSAQDQNIGMARAAAVMEYGLPPNGWTLDLDTMEIVAADVTTASPAPLPEPIAKKPKRGK